MQKVSKVCRFFLIVLFVLSFVNFSNLRANDEGQPDEEQANELGLALLNAAENGEVEEVERLLYVDAPIDFVNEDNETALLIAADKGHEKVVVVLVNRGANVNIQNRWGETPLLCAALRNHIKICVFLLANLADVEITNKNGESVLKCCCNETIINIDSKIMRLLRYHYWRNQLRKVVFWPVKRGKRVMQLVGVCSSFA